MTNTVVDNTCKALQRIACVNSTSVPGGDATVAKSDAGVLQIFEGVDPLTSGGSGVPSKVKVVPGSTGSATYDLTVYGAMWIGGPAAHTDGPWLWIPLFKGSVAATTQYAGDVSTGYITTADYMPATITAASNGPSDAVVTNYGSTVGPAHVVFASRGCPYLLFQASAANKFVLAVGLS